MIAAIVVNLNDAYDDRIAGCRFRFRVNSNRSPLNCFALILTPISGPSSYLYSCDAIIAPEHSNAPNADDNREPIDVHSGVKLVEGTDARHALNHGIDPMAERFYFAHPVKPQQLEPRTNDVVQGKPVQVQKFNIILVYLRSFDRTILKCFSNFSPTLPANCKTHFQPTQSLYTKWR